MKKTSLTLLLLFALTTLTWTQSSDCNFAKNYQDRVILDEDKLEITYDLPPNGSHRLFDVSLKTSNDNIRPKTYISGTGQVIAGDNLKITWYYKQDGYQTVDISNISVVVMATDPLDPCMDAQKSVAKEPSMRTGAPVTAGLGILSASGLALIVSGAVIVGQNGTGSDDYKFYEENPDPTSPVWDDAGTTRDEFYNDLNSKYKTGQWLLIGGSALVATAGAILITRIIQDKKARKLGRLQVDPFLVPNLAASGKGVPSLRPSGMGVRMRVKMGK